MVLPFFSSSPVYEPLGVFSPRRPAWTRYLIFGGVTLALLVCYVALSSPEWNPIPSLNGHPDDDGDWLPPPPPGHHDGLPPPEEEQQDGHRWRPQRPPPVPVPNHEWDDASSTTLSNAAATPTANAQAASPPPPPTLVEIIRALFEPMKLPITAPSWTDSDGQEFTIPENPVWNKPLGKRLCIIDIDTRPLNDTNQILDLNGHFNWTEYGQTSSGMMGHYLYAQIHGYDYKFIRTQNFEDRSAYWTKIPALSDHLRDYEFVISIDADAQIEHPEIPFEWLLNRWNVKNTTAMTMTIDPDEPQNLDPFKRPYNNAGFVVAHNVPRTHEMLKAWASCPDEPNGEFKDCSRWKEPWPAEQAAFGEYIRYKFSEPDDLNEIPCDEANGFPESETECHGRFIRHLWSRKWAVRDVVSNGLMQVLMGRLHNQFINDESIIVQRESNEFTRDS